MRLCKVDVICVGFASHAFYPSFLAALRRQVGVDLHLYVIEQGGSAPAIGLVPFAVSVLQGENIGYAGGNDFGFKLARLDAEVVVFMNPDCFLRGDDFLLKAAEALRSDENLGALQPVLLRYDFASKSATGQYDSLGIVRSAYGKWSDFGQGKAVEPKPPVPARIDAVCGACIVAKRSALVKLLRRDGYIFDPRFFMYKEDIDLSLRLVELGCRLAISAELKADHCRGWRSRKDMDWRMKYLSARNELKINRRWPLPWLYSLLKLAFVTGLEARRKKGDVPAQASRNDVR